MPGYVSANSGGDFKVLAPGSYVGVCDQVVFVGKQETVWGTKPQVWLRWQVPAERTTWDKGGETHEGPMVIGAMLTANIHEKATLGKWLASWRGRPFTPEEKEKFDLFAVLGKPCLLTVVHNESKGRTYANITNVARLAKGMEEPKLEGEPLKYSADEPQSFERLAEWLQKKINGQIRDEPAKWTGRPDVDGEPFADDQIPF